MRTWLLLLCVACGSRGGVHHESIPAPSLRGSAFPNADPQEALVFLPASYASGERAYPVVYYLPGFLTELDEYLDGSLGGLRLDRALAGGPEIIVVVPNGMTVLGGGFYVDSPASGNWDSYISADLVAAIDRRYRTLPGERGIAGDGMGGFGALTLAMRHPDVFRSVYALSASLFGEDGFAESRLVLPEHIVAHQLVLAQLEDHDLTAFCILAGELYASYHSFNHRRLLAYAYAAAFAPDARQFPPFAFPPPDDDDGGDGLGGWKQKIARNGGGLRRLRGVVLDYGRTDRSRYIPHGNEQVAALLRDAGVEVEVRAHDGGHTDRLSQRFAGQLLPFFAATLGEGRR